MMLLVNGKYEKALEYCREHLKGEKFFEFCFGYVAAGEKFREIDRFLWESRHQCTRYRNRYEGATVIDLSQWSQKFPNDYFEAFLYFLKDYSRNSTCMFISDKHCRKELLDMLKELMEIQTVELEPAKNKPVVKRVIGFRVNDEEEHENV